MVRKATGGKPGRPFHPEVLTPADQRVLDGVREGLHNAEIGVRLGITPDGVKFHVSNMLAKLNLSSREELARWEAPRVGAFRRLWAAVPVVGKWTVAGVGGVAMLSRKLDSTSAGGGMSAIETSNGASTDFRPASTFGPNAVGLYPVLSGDGHYVAFGITVGGQPQIAI